MSPVLTRLRNRIAARHLLWPSRRAYTVELELGPLLVLPGVLDPHATKVGAWLAGVMATEVRAGEVWVDMGCGTGVVGVEMALAGARVVCLDIDPACVANARANALLRGAALEARESDLFTALSAVATRNDPDPPSADLDHPGLDGVVYNVPFWPGDPAGRPFGRAMYAGEGFEAVRRYREEADRLGLPRVLAALSEAGARHHEARAAFGPHRVVRRDRVGGEWLVLIEADGRGSSLP